MPSCDRALIQIGFHMCFFSFFFDVYIWLTSTIIQFQRDSLMKSAKVSKLLKQIENA